MALIQMDAVLLEDTILQLKGLSFGTLVCTG